MNPRARLGAFLAAKGWSRAALARAVGFDPSMINLVMSGRRTPGRRLANALTRITADWEEGPIRPEEWDPKRDSLPPPPPAKDHDDAA